MATWDDVQRIAGALADSEPSTSWGRPCFKVAGKAFVTLRPLSKRDRAQLAELGRRIPESELVLVRVEHDLAKEAVLHSEEACFSIPHLDGYPGVLVELDRADEDLLTELVTESFLLAGGELEPRR